MSDYKNIIDHLKTMQRNLQSKYANSDFVVHVGDALFILRMFRNSGMDVRRAHILVPDETSTEGNPSNKWIKASYWTISGNGLPTFKVMVDQHNVVAKGDVYVIPHTTYNIKLPEIKIDYDYAPNWQMRYGYTFTGKPYGDTSS